MGLITRLIVPSTLSLCMLDAIAMDHTHFTQYHDTGIAIQLSTNSLGFGYYGNHHSYTIGGGISPYTYLKKRSGNSNNIDYHVYGRKNFALTNRTLLGLGFIAGNRSGQDSGKTIHYDYNLGPYFIIEVAATRHILIAGSLSVFNYRDKRLGGDPREQTFTFVKGGSAQVAYLF